MHGGNGIGGWRVALVWGLVLVATYAACVLVPFGVTDDFFNLEAALKGHAWSWTSVASGRPLLAVFAYAGFSAMSEIADLRFLRLVAVLGAAICAYQLHLAMLRAGWNRTVAAAGAYLVCTMPAYQVLASWAICFSCLPAAAVAIAGHRLAVLAFEGNSAAARRRLGAAAVAVTASAGMIYQPSMLVYVAPLAIDWFRPGGRPPRAFARLVWVGAVLAAAMAIELIAYELGTHLLGSYLDPARARLAVNLAAKLSWFIHGPLIDAVQLWSVFPVPDLTIVVAVAMTIGLLLFFQGPFLERLLCLAVAVGLLPLAYLANLASSESWGAYRTQLALGSLLAIYALLAFQGWARLLPRRLARVLVPTVAAIAAVGAGVLAADHVLRYYAETQTIESSVMKSQLRHIDLASVHKLYVQPAPWNGFILSRYDEFGLPTTAQPWGPGPMTTLVIRELTGTFPRFPIVGVPRGDHAEPKAGEAVIDLTNLDAYR